MNSFEAADRFRAQNGTPYSEPALSTSARQLVGGDNRPLGLAQRTVNDASYTFTADDAGKRLLIGPAVQTMTIPKGLQVDFACALLNMNDNTVTITAAAGLTLTLIPDGTAPGGGFDLAQYGNAYIQSISATDLVISGNSGLS